MEFSVGIIIAIIVLIIWICFMIFLWTSTSHKDLEQRIDVTHVNQNSFQNYAKFYGEIFPNDDQFDYKLNKIYVLIHDHHVTDIKRIAEISICEIPECVLKIKYLKNKRLIDDLYIDTVQMKLIPCSVEDQKLLDQYKPFVYGSHLQPDEIANVLPNPNYLDIVSLRKKVFDDIQYLNQKGLINGIKVDDIDHRIIYYTIEKRKKYPDHQTVHCPNCGALNDVDITSKVRCSYCQTIVKGEKYEEEIPL